ncbi:unnamed protein product [Cunninghamella blakesleeana]
MKSNTYSFHYKSENKYLNYFSSHNINLWYYKVSYFHFQPNKSTPVKAMALKVYYKQRLKGIRYKPNTPKSTKKYIEVLIKNINNENTTLSSAIYNFDSTVILNNNIVNQYLLQGGQQPQQRQT